MVEPEVLAGARRQGPPGGRPFLVRYEVARRQRPSMSASTSAQGPDELPRCLSPVTYPVDLHLESDSRSLRPPRWKATWKHSDRARTRDITAGKSSWAGKVASELSCRRPTPPCAARAARGSAPQCGANLNEASVRAPGEADLRFPGALGQEQTLKRDRSQQCRYQRGDTRAPGETSAGPTIRVTVSAVSFCPNCQEPKAPHKICPKLWILQGQRGDQGKKKLNTGVLPDLSCAGGANSPGMSQGLDLDRSIQGIYALSWKTARRIGSTKPLNAQPAVPSVSAAQAALRPRRSRAGHGPQPG